MGNICAEIYKLCFKWLIPKKDPTQPYDSTTPDSYNFSDTNDNKFMIPKDYFKIIKKIKDKILVDDTCLWPTYQVFLQTSKSYFIKLLTSLKSYQKLSISENIPFETIFQMEKVFPKKHSKKFILEIQKAIFSSENNPQTESLSKPFVEIEIYPNQKLFPDRVVYFQTKIGEPVNTPEWNEVFVYEFEHDEIKSHGKFEISLYYIENTILNTKRLIDKKHIFEFSELSNQRVNEKIIKLKDSATIIGQIFMRVQLVINYEKFLADWINELEVKLEIIERILKINSEIINVSPKKPHRSSEFRKKLNYKEVGEEKYIEMTFISKSWEDHKTDNLINIENKSPVLFGVKPNPILKLEEFNLESFDDSAKDKNEYFENHFFIK